MTEQADIGGLSLSLIDTAGVRDTADVVEQEGVARAKAAVDVADLTSCCSIDRGRSRCDDRELLGITALAPRVVAWNKIDLPPSQPLEPLDPDRGGGDLGDDRRRHRSLDRRDRRARRSATGRSASRSPAGHQRAACRAARARAADRSTRAAAALESEVVRRISAARSAGSERARCRKSPAGARRTICCATSSSVSASGSKDPSIRAVITRVSCTRRSLATSSSASCRLASMPRADNRMLISQLIVES